MMGRWQLCYEDHWQVGFLWSAYISESYHSSTLSVDCPCFVEHGPIFSLGCT